MFICLVPQKKTFQCSVSSHHHVGTRTKHTPQGAEVSDALDVKSVPGTSTRFAVRFDVGATVVFDGKSYTLGKLT